MGSGLYGQFPAPCFFQFSYDYIPIDELGECNDSSLYGPAYCSHFSWCPPDTSQTDAKLDCYRIYQDGFPLVSLVDTCYHTVGGFIGKLYVTAIYKDPYGESDSSNVVSNYDLPISYGAGVSHENFRMRFSRQNGLLIPNDVQGTYSLIIYDILGRELLCTPSVKGPVDVSRFAPGMYLIRTQPENGQERVQKVLLE